MFENVNPKWLGSSEGNFHCYHYCKYTRLLRPTYSYKI